MRTADVRIRFSGVIEDELTGEVEPGWVRITVAPDGTAALEVGARGRVVADQQGGARTRFLETILAACFGRPRPRGERAGVDRLYRGSPEALAAD